MRTKIIATIGPATNSRQKLSELIEAGVRIFRLNFSHGDATMFEGLIALIRELETEYDTPITILQDLSGPKMRIGQLSEYSYTLKKHDRLVLGPSGSEHVRQLPFIPFDVPEILETLEVGDKIVLADGVLPFRVTENLNLGAFEIECRNDGFLTSRKGLALPGKPINLPAMTEKDQKDLRDGLRLGVDACALSFVQTPEDIEVARKIILKAGKNIPIIAKLERENSVKNLDAILKVTDIIMVARGDLGVECPLPQLPAMQKRIIEACNRAGKPVIVATQMLLSMVNNPVPTRAETTDVANAILDGTDCLMLSEETAMGNFPIQTVKYMTSIAQEAEKYYFEQERDMTPSKGQSTPDFLAYSACLMAEKVEAKALVCHSNSGASARLMSARRPNQLVHALTPNENVRRALNFSWGVVTDPVDKSIEAHLQRAETFVETSPEFRAGDRVVITAGQPKPGGQARGTNLVKIYHK